MTKLAVLGGGMLGSDLSALARKSGYEVKIYDLPEFDICSPEQVSKAVSESDCIVNCAAYTAVDKAESEKELCRKVNSEALALLGKQAKAAGKYVLHISTDFVFGDKGTKPLSETDAPNPLNVYGKTKLDGERLLAETGCKNSIIRVQWTYGQNGDNFVTKILALAKKLDSMKIVDDQIGSPTHTIDVSKAILCFLEKRPEGLYHFAASGYASRFETAKFIFNHMNVKTSISPCPSSEFQTPAERPLNSRFNCEKIDKILNVPRLPWQDSLKLFLNEKYGAQSACL